MATEYKSDFYEPHFRLINYCICFGYRTLQPLEFYKTFLDKNTRPDGRSLLEFRSTTLNVGSVGTADGSAIVKCGNTTVVCGIKAVRTSIYQRLHISNSAPDLGSSTA